MVPHFNKITNTMSIVIGNKTISDIYIENKEVQRITIGNKVAYEKFIDYLYIENTYNGQNTVELYANSAAGTTDAQYSKDKVNWTNMVFDTFPKTISITLNQGEKVYFRSSTGWSGDTNGIRIQPQQSAIAGGDIRTILNYTNVNSITSVGRYDINCLFKAGGTAISPISGLTDISNVKLNTISSTSATNAFRDFCWNCPNLVTGMDLSSITSIYDSPTFDPDAGFRNMYYQCRRLTEAWAPNVTTWDADQFGDWLYRTAASGVVHIPSGLCVGSSTGCIPENSTSGIPSGWTYQTY